MEVLTGNNQQNYNSMKGLLYKPQRALSFLALLIVMIAIDTLHAESYSDNVSLSLAKKYRLGINCDVNPQKAFKIYLSLIEKGSTKAMDEMGNMFLKGEGVNQDYPTAMQYFKQASDLENAQATYHLGTMYHKGFGVKQDFAQAFEYYDKAAQAGNHNGYYGAGYLTYKGFGIQQDYEKAIAYFEKGAALNDKNCEYMLALYYLTGHDDKQDFNKGKQLLYKTLKHGHPWLEDFTKYNVVDSLRKVALSDQAKWAEVKTGRITRKKRFFENNATDSILQGKWVGKLYTYDWSGQKIEREQSIQLNLKADNGTLALQWYENDSLLTNYKAERFGNKFTATVSSQLELNPKAKWVLSATDFDMENTKNKKVLYANLQQYEIEPREPLYPTLAVLEKMPDDPITITNIYPNPFQNNIKVDFEITSGQKIKPEIYNGIGVKVYSGTKLNYPKGKNSMNINLSLPQGTYTLYLKGDNYICSHNIIRK
jgi:TPR repeat protein